MHDARLLDWIGTGTPFLRVQKRVSAAAVTPKKL
jgi:hypothetical protein